MGWDLTLHADNIERYTLRGSDFAKHQFLWDEGQKSQLLKRCEELATEGFEKIQIETVQVSGKTAYKIISFEHELVLRLIIRSLRSKTGRRQNNRRAIVAGLKTVLSEGLEYNVFKFDITSFYENISPDDICNDLHNLGTYPPSHLELLRSFLKSISAEVGQGLPRGVAVSAALSEFVMAEFDKSMRRRPGVWFYQRYVDDLIIVTSATICAESFTNVVNQALPGKLQLNPRKSCVMSFHEKPLKENEQSKVLKEFSYLGYKIEVYNRQRQKSGIAARRVFVDISKNKERKIKTRLAKSFQIYTENKNFNDLLSRLRILSGNYILKGKRRGIYFSYPLVDITSSKAIPAIDKLLHGIVLGNKTPLAREVDVLLSGYQKKQLLKCNFSTGYAKRTHWTFSKTELRRLMRGWEYL